MQSSDQFLHKRWEQIILLTRTHWKLANSIFFGLFNEAALHCPEDGQCQTKN